MFKLLEMDFEAPNTVIVMKERVLRFYAFSMSITITLFSSDTRCYQIS